MNAIFIKLNIIILGLSIIVLPVIGYFISWVQLQKKQQHIRELEREVLSCHAEILSNEKELSGKKQQKAEATPVITLRDNALPLKAKS